MGLEAGWNCHVSLLSPPIELHTASPSQQDLSEGSKGASYFSSHQSIVAGQKNNPETGTLQEHLGHRRLSAPGAINNRPGTSSMRSEPYGEVMYGSSKILDYLGQQEVLKEEVDVRHRTNNTDDGVYVKDPPLGGALVGEGSSDHVHFDISEPLLCRRDVETEAVAKKHKLLQYQVDTGSSHDSTISVFDDNPSKNTGSPRIYVDSTGCHGNKEESRLVMSTDDDSVHPLLSENIEMLPRRYSTERRKNQNLNSHNNLKGRVEYCSCHKLILLR